MNEEEVGVNKLKQVISDDASYESNPAIIIDEGTNYSIVPMGRIQHIGVGVWEPTEKELDRKKFIPELAYKTTRFYRVRLYLPDAIQQFRFYHEDEAKKALETLHDAMKLRKSATFDDEDGVVQIVENNNFEKPKYYGNRCDYCGTEDVKIVDQSAASDDKCVLCSTKLA